MRLTSSLRGILLLFINVLAAWLRLLLVVVGVLSLVKAALQLFGALSNTGHGAISLTP